MHIVPSLRRGVVARCPARISASEHARGLGSSTHGRRTLRRSCMHRRVRSLALALLALLVLAPAASAAHHKAAAKTKPVKGILLSLGDSYSVGWQELPGGTQGPTHNGPADQLVPLAAARGWHLKLVNLGCGGATTNSMLTASAGGGGPPA